MPKPGFFRSLFAGVVKPAPAHPLLRHVAKSSVRRMVEIGIGDGQRARDSIELMVKHHGRSDVRYTGIDLFEGRTDGSGLTLKAAHRLLGGMCDGVRLVPGAPGVGLKRCANELRGTDLVVVSCDQDQQSLNASWHFLPRMLHNESQVWLENSDGQFEVLSPADVRARMTSRRIAA